MNFEDEINKAVLDITTNHNKIIDDWSKAYMAQRYIEGKSIDVGSFTLCQQNLSWAQNQVGFKYWFEDGKPDLSINGINFSLEEIKDLLMNLDQCKSEGYLNYGDHAYSAMEKLLTLLEIKDE